MNGMAFQEVFEFKQRQCASRRVDYHLVTEVICRPELGEYRTYGIRYRCAGRDKILHDVSVNPRIVKHIVNLINRHDASPLHLRDIVNDLIP